MKGARIQPETSAIPPPTRCHSTVTWKSTWTINSAARAATDDVNKRDVRGFSRHDSRLLTLKSVVVVALPLLSLTVLLCLSVADGVIEGRMSENQDCARATAAAKVTIVFALMLERKMAARYLQRAAGEQRQHYRNTVNLTTGFIANDGCDTDRNTRTERSLFQHRLEVLDQNVTSSAAWAFYSDVISNELRTRGVTYIGSTCRLEPSCAIAMYLHQFLVSINVFEQDEFANLRDNTTDVHSGTVSALSQYTRLFYPSSNSRFVFSAEYNVSQKMRNAYKQAEEYLTQPQYDTSSLGSDIKVILDSTVRRQQWLSRISLIVLVILSVFATSPYLYVLVRFANRLYHIPNKVRSCFEIVDRKSAELEIGRQRSDALLQQMLPKKVIAELKRGRTIEAEKFDEVTIYFSDIVGFNEVALEASPIIVVDLLNCIYSAFDECIDQYDVYKVETIGDSYLVASGLPQRNGAKHVAEICSMALNMVDVAREYSLPGSVEPLPIRIGINTGPLVTAVIGLKNPRYCLFGDTINTASRMQSTGETFRIQTTEAVRNAADKFGNYEFEIRGNMTIKGKGTMRTYWLKSKSNKLLTTDATLPVGIPAERSG